jgi:ankyrin repeat protein
MRRTTGTRPANAGEEVAVPLRPLPPNPSLEHLRKEAKRLRNAVRAGDAVALDQVREFHPRSPLDPFPLSEAQLVVARSYGFPSWPKLIRHLADIRPLVWTPSPVADPPSRADVFIRLACLTYLGWHRANPERARRMLADEPELAAASLYTAAAAGDVAAVAAALEREPRVVNLKGGPLRWEPLLYACYSRFEPDTLAVVRLLLAHGADPNAGFLFDGTYAFTALTGAFGRGEDWDNMPPHPSCEVVARALLEAGADPNDTQTVYNRHFHENDDHLRLLLSFGLGHDKGGPWLARLNDRRFTPSQLLVEELWAAARNNFPARVELLVRHGADVNRPGLRNGRTPYEMALHAGNDAIAAYLLDHGARKIELGPLDMFALACVTGRREEVRDRIAADPTLLDRLGRKGLIELLHRASGERRQDGVRLIVELGADVNGMIPGTGYDRAALHNAAGWGGVEMVQFLISLGADPHLRDLAYRSTPIGWAYHNRQSATVAALLPYASIFDALRCDGVERVAEWLSADPTLADARDEHGTPLVFYLHPQLERLDEMLALLVAHGADLDARNRKGKTALEVAVAGGLNDFADVLRRYGA